MIDPKTGILTISETVKIKPGASLESILTQHLGESQQLNDLGNDWKWLNINNVESEGAYFILTFRFSSDVLGSVELIRSKSRFDLTADWNKWSEESETELLIDLQQWLEKELGSKKKFDWGSADAHFDWKSGSSRILVVYAHP